MSAPRNCFTVDLEDWYHGNEHIKLADFPRFESRIDHSTNLLLDLLDEFEVKATFFVLGYVADGNGALLRRIHERGHEIASHGYSHELVYRQSHEEFRRELKKSKQLCEDATGVEVVGHRASNWTITEESMWAIDVLQEEGFRYDSSIYPLRTYLFGVAGAPRTAYRLPGGLLEIPPSTIRWAGRTVPFSGGFFLRAWPRPLLQWCLRRVNAEGHGAVLYVHPWELDRDQPRNLPLPFKNRIIHYYGLRSTGPKLRALFSRFRFHRMDEVFL